MLLMLTLLAIIHPIQILTPDSEKTLAALDHVIGYYHVAEEVEPVIRDGLVISVVYNMTV